MEMNKTRALFQAIKEMIKYGCVGILSTAANLAMFWMLESAGLFYIAANAIAYFGAVIINFYLNEWLVFIQDDEKKKKSGNGRLLRFLLIRVISLGADSLLFYLCVDILLLPLYPSRIGLTLVEIIVTYVLVKTMVFGEK